MTSDCWKSAKGGKTMWPLWYKAHDDRKLDMVKAWYRDKGWKPGDLVSAKIKATGGP